MWQDLGDCDEQERDAGQHRNTARLHAGQPAAMSRDVTAVDADPGGGRVPGH
jgi:hypothetical protein